MAGFHRGSPASQDGEPAASEPAASDDKESSDENRVEIHTTASSLQSPSRPSLQAMIASSTHSLPIFASSVIGPSHLVPYPLYTYIYFIHMFILMIMPL
jgi:hypothetical protein